MEVAALCRQRHIPSGLSSEPSRSMKYLIWSRKVLAEKHSPERRFLSKLIQKGMRKQVRAQHQKEEARPYKVFKTAQNRWHQKQWEAGCCAKGH